MEDNKKDLFGSQESSEGTNVLDNGQEQPTSTNTYPSEQQLSPIQEQSINTTSTEIIDNEFRSAKNDNELFFEKFNNTKKNYKKAELEKARKQINKKNKSLSFERRLEDNRFVGMIYGIIGAIIFFVLAISITVFVINLKFYYPVTSDVYSTQNAWFGISYFINVEYFTMNRAIVIMEGIAFSLVLVPFFFLMTTWFVGINQMFRSRKFMMFLFTCIGISVLLVLITIPMFSIIYSKNGFLNINNIDNWVPEDKK